MYILTTGILKSYQAIHFLKTGDSEIIPGNILSYDRDPEIIPGNILSYDSDFEIIPGNILSYDRGS